MLPEVGAHTRLGLTEAVDGATMPLLVNVKQAVAAGHTPFCTVANIELGLPGKQHSQGEVVLLV
jgi:hypothetical protein